MLLKKLGSIVGRDNLANDADAVSTYFKDAPPAAPLTAVYPNDADQVVEIILSTKSVG